MAHLELNRLNTGLAVGAGLGLLGGCGSEPGGGPEATAGFDLVEQVVDRSPRLGLQETWRVGHAEDPSGTQLHLVRAADVGSDGSVFLLDAGNDRVVVVDSTGTPVRESGRAGSGPGEFQGPRGLVVRRDTLLVRDSNRRVHFFQAGGELVSTHVLQFEGEEVAHLSLVAASPDGWLVSARGYFRGGSVDEPPLHREHLFRVDPGTGALDATGLRWSKESIGESHDDFFWLQPILAHRPTVTLDGLGHFLVSDTATYRIDVHGLDGTHSPRIENEVERLPLDEQVVDLWRASRSCPVGSETAAECSREMDRKTLSLPRTEHRPVVSRLRAYATGHFSVLRGDLDPDPFEGVTPAQYDHFDPNGAFLGSTSGTSPLWFDGRAMISLERDSLGVESVVRYRVDGPSARSPSP